MWSPPYCWVNPSSLRFIIAFGLMTTPPEPSFFDLILVSFLDHFDIIFEHCLCHFWSFWWCYFMIFFWWFLWWYFSHVWCHFWWDFCMVCKPHFCMFSCFHENWDFLLVLCFPMILLVFTSSSVHLLSIGCHMFSMNFNMFWEGYLNCSFTVLGTLFVH